MMVRKPDRTNDVTELPTAHSATATDEAISLLQPSVKPRLRTDLGYVDLLGEQNRRDMSFWQRIFEIEALPTIYERFSRPLASRWMFGKGFTETEERELVLRMLAVGPEDRILDVGCGPGNYTRLLANAAEDGLVVGIDTSKVMISAALKKGKGDRLAYVCGDGGELPFKDGLFDAVCCVGVIHALDDPLAALDGMVRMLAPGGRVAIVALCRKGTRRRNPKLAGVTVFEPDELADALTKHGLVDVQQRVSKRGQVVGARRPSE